MAGHLPPDLLLVLGRTPVWDSVHVRRKPKLLEARQCGTLECATCQTTARTAAIAASNPKVSYRSLIQWPVSGPPDHAAHAPTHRPASAELSTGRGSPSPIRSAFGKSFRLGERPTWAHTGMSASRSQSPLLADIVEKVSVALTRRNAQALKENNGSVLKREISRNRQLFSLAMHSVRGRGF